MELTSKQMYWLLMLDNISLMTSFVTIVGGVALLVTAIGFLVIQESIDPFKKLKKFWLTSITVVAVCALLGTFIPTTKQMAAIIVVPKIVNNEQVQQMPDKVLNLGLEWLEELKPNKGAE
jgi:magnesium-transporting ATPase (P-type)